MADLDPIMTSDGPGPSTPRITAAPQSSETPRIRAPTVIMRERAERETRQRAEREQRERSRAEEEARTHEEQRRRAAAERRESAGGGIAAAGEAVTGPATERRQQRAKAQVQENLAGTAKVDPRMQTGAAAQMLPQAVPAPLRTTRVPTSTLPPQGFPSAQQMGPDATASGPQVGESSAMGAGVSGTRPRNAFPHAFERWEALSAHWEGMTSFWVRKLQENSEQLERNPVSSQLSRQVGDLSAAGANLFHAVVELQRLRTSSERKFQRWFFETRAEMERLKENNAVYQKALEQERMNRNNYIREALEREQAKSKTHKQLNEMRRELQISKEEARRAWEELGRREQEERNRQTSLQQGQPTVVGGVQVVPMTQGVPVRATNVRDGRQAQGQGAEYAEPSAAGFPPPTGLEAEQAQGRPTSGATTPGEFYERPGPSAETESYGDGSDASYSEGEFMLDTRGNYLRDRHGNKIPYRSPTPEQGQESNDGAEEYGPSTTQPASTTNYPPSSSQWAYAGAPEYSGQGYAAPGWETMPRHHHPTRLSDVMEEDERSRASTSHVSRH